MKYKIDKGIPIPKKPGKYQQLVSEMSKGDSVLITTTREKAGLTAAFKRFGIKIVTRKEEGGFRIWRAS